MNGDELSPRDKTDIVVSLRDYFSLQFREHEKAHIKLDKAVEVALAAQDKRLDAMNEFRATITDVQARAITREQFDAQHEVVKNRLSALEVFRGRAGLIATGIAITAGAFGAVLGALVGHLLK